VERYINTASEAIERWCGRRFARAIVLAEKSQPRGSPRLLVARCPLVSVQAIRYDGDALDPTTYAIEDAAAGIIYFDGAPAAADLAFPGSIGRDPVLDSGEYLLEVDYTGGYLLPGAVGRDLPYDLEHACLLTVAHMWRLRKGNYAKSEMPFRSADTGRGGIIPDVALPILEDYRRVEVG
jgi:hypothetical protein